MDDVRIVNISLSKTTGGINTNVHNTNADLGYIPQYPGVADENELDISMNLVSSYQSVELMGRSKNIDKIIDSINPDVDPYVTDETIRENGLFGRVWEDFADAPDDKSLLIIENEALFPNMGTTDEYGFTEDNDYYWKIDFGTLGYEHDQVSCLKVLIYNTTTLGRNPYFVGDLSSIVQDSTEAGVPISTNYIVDGGFQSTEIELTSGTSNIKITGTCNGVNEINGYFSNAINGIEDVRIWSEQVFNRDILKITFKRKRDQIPMDTFVDKGVVRVAIFNTRDFSRLEYYHFLDTHGFIIGRGNDAKFVYKDKDGNISNKPISEIHLSAYRNLDDIYPLATSERLQFKYSEEDVFD